MNDGFTIDGALHVLNRQHFTKQIIKWLNNEGYTVHPNGNWETPKQLAARLGVKIGVLSKRLRSPRRPNVAISKGKTGRTLEIASNHIFEEFVKGKDKNVSKQTGDNFSYNAA